MFCARMETNDDGLGLGHDTYKKGRDVSDALISFETYWLCVCGKVLGP